MSCKGNCIDNCVMKTFFGRLKNEMYYGYEKDYESFETFQLHWMNTFITTTMNVFREKQNGCHLLSTG